MKNNTQFPPRLLARAIKLYFKGQVHFTKQDKGKIVKEKEEDFVIFRKIMVTHQVKQNSKAAVTLKIFFRFKRFSLQANRILSLIPVPFIIAQQGFQSKTWLYGRQTGTFYGLYKWDSNENAQKYQDSFPLRLMKKRAIKETLLFQIIEK